MRIHLASALSLLLPISGCNSPIPEATWSSHFRTLGGGFISDANGVAYAVMVQTRKPINGDQSWYASAEFENPESTAVPMTLFLAVPKSQTEVSLVSKKVSTIKNHTNYTVTLRAYADIDRKLLIATHTMLVRFEVPDSQMAAMGVKPL